MPTTQRESVSESGVVEQLPPSRASIGNRQEAERSERFGECINALLQKLPSKHSFELQNLSGQNLHNVAGCSLRGSDLLGATLSGDCTNIDLRFARVDGANLLEADLTGAKLAQPFYRNSVSFAQLPQGPINAEIHGPNFQELDLRRFSRIVCPTPGALFHDSILDGVDLSGCCLREADLRKQDLRTTNLPTDLRGANLSHADLRGKDLSETDLGGANLSGAKLEGTNLPHSLQRVNLRRTNVLRIHLTGPDLRHADLSEIDFRGCDLSTWDIRGADLSGCRLNDSDTERSYVPDQCKGPVKLPVHLDAVNLTGNDLTGIDLAHSSLNGATLAETTIDFSTRLPRYLQHIDFTGALFENVDLSRHDCSGSEFEGACFIGCQPPQSIVDSYNIIDRTDGAIKIGSRIKPTPIEDSDRNSPDPTDQSQQAEKVPITPRGACAAIHAIIQDPEVIYSFFLPRSSEPPHAHQIYMKRVDEDAVVLLWRDRETESLGAYVELGIIVENGQMTEIPELRRVVSAQQDFDFRQLVANDISDIIFGYHETSGRGPSIQISDGPHKGIYHTALATTLPGLEHARFVAGG